MQTSLFYEYLGKCIQKVRLPHYTQDELSKNICSKYTLSRIENGRVFSKKGVYTRLLNKLGFHIENNVDYFIFQSFIKTLYLNIEYHRKEELLKLLEAMNMLIKRNRHNILFVDFTILYSYLYTHYIEMKAIVPNEHDFNTMIYHNDKFYTLLVHTYSENLLKYHSLTKFYQFYEKLPKQRGNVLLDFLYAFKLQMKGQTLEVADLYNAHKDALQVERKTFQLVRFLCIVSIGHIEYEPDKAIRNFETIQHVYHKQTFKTNYLYILAFGYACIYIKQKQYREAFRSFHECVKSYPDILHYALPYLILLSFQINEEVDEAYLVYNHSPLSNACLDYHVFKQKGLSGTNNIKYLIRHIIPHLHNFCMSDPFIMLLRAEEQVQFSRRACNVTAIRFYVKLKETCREVSLL